MENDKKQLTVSKLKPPSKLIPPSKLTGASTLSLTNKPTLIIQKPTQIVQKPTQTLPKPTQILPKLAQVVPKPSQIVAKPNRLLQNVIQRNKIGLRRSKSYSDITTVKSTLKRPILNTRPLRPLTTSSSTSNIRQPVKRPADDKITNVVKPKIVKANPPKYDFKARFNILEEKHKNLIQEHKSLKENYASIAEQSDVVSVKIQRLEEQNKKYKIDLAEFDEFKQKYKYLEETNTKLNENLNELNKAIDDQTKENSNLKDVLKEKNEQFDDVSKKYCKSEVELTGAKAEIELLNNSIKSYKSEVQELHEIRRTLHNQVQDLKGNIRVFCRVRQTTEDEEDKLIANISFIDESSLELKRSKESINPSSGKNVELKHDFNFDKVFPPQAMQEEVFEDLAQLIQSALDGYNVCVFAYGQTGSGKTYTMQGTEEQVGMIPRSMEHLFNRIEHLKSSGWVYNIKASFLEIYNETIKDLLDPNSNSSYDIKFNEGKGTTVTNLTIQDVDSPKHLKQLMWTATRNRAIASTNYNEHSSRSHAVTKIYIEGHNIETQACYIGSLNLVDLAGSESAKTSTTERIAETKHINKSLSTLGNVMLALHNGNGHIPYRNSKLTFLLQPCLGGNSKTLMFINISPFEECFNETINSLRFATKVKEVKVSSKRNKIYK